MKGIKVEHRPDRLLHRAKNGCPPGLENTYIGRVTIPTHNALLRFLDERVVGKTFQNKEELEQVLATWPSFAKKIGLPLDKEFEKLWITKKGTIAAASGLGGDFEIAVIHEG